MISQYAQLGHTQYFIKGVTGIHTHVGNNHVSGRIEGYAAGCVTLEQCVHSVVEAQNTDHLVRVKYMCIYLHMFRRGVGGREGIWLKKYPMPKLNTTY